MHVNAICSETTEIQRSLPENRSGLLAAIAKKVKADSSWRAGSREESVFG